MQNNEINEVKYYLLAKNYYVGVQKEKSGVLLNLPKNVFTDTDLYVAEYVLSKNNVHLTNSLGHDEEFKIPNYSLRVALATEISWITKGLNYDPIFTLLFDENGDFIEDSAKNVTSLIDYKLTQKELELEDKLSDVLIKTISNNFANCQEDAKKSGVYEAYDFIYKVVLNEGKIQ